MAATFASPVRSRPAATAARIDAAEALMRQAEAARAPEIVADGMVGGARQSENLGIPPQFVPNGIRDTGRLTVTARFDLDLWGRNRAPVAAATSDAEAARVDADQARLMLTTAVAAAYADLATYHLARDVAGAALEVREDAG